jgi:hypothetical protein
LLRGRRDPQRLHEFQQFVSVHGVRTIPTLWERKRLACPDADAPPSQSIPPVGGGQVGGLNDYTISAIIRVGKPSVTRQPASYQATRINPPLTSSTWPVIKLDSSEARKR